MDNICEKNIIHFANGFIPNQLPYNLFANIFNEKILKKALERINKNIAKNSEALVKVADVHSDAKSYNEHGGAECISFSAYKKYKKYGCDKSQIVYCICLESFSNKRSMVKRNVL